MSIIAYPLEATEYTAEDVQSYLSTRTSGVYSEDITFTPEGMTVTVSPFLAWFNYAKFKGCSVAVTEPETLTFSPAHAVLHRADRIVLRLDFTVNKAYFTILEGTPSSYPVSVPRISRSEAVYDLCLATVFIAAGSTEILGSDITSELLNDKVCGIMRDGVTGIPTAQLQAQVEELILRLHEAIDGVESGSAFMMSDLYDPQKKAKPVAFDDETIKKDGSTPFTATNTYFGNGYARVYAADWAAFLEHRNSPGDEKNGRSIMVQNSNRYDLSLAAKLADTINGNTKYYLLFGEHNKPSGSYVGNGNSRTINIGGVNGVVYIYTDDSPIIQAFATAKTGFGWQIYDSGVQIIDTSVAYVDGALYIDSSNDVLNSSGKTYYYTLL